MTDTDPAIMRGVAQLLRAHVPDLKDYEIALLDQAMEVKTAADTEAVNDECRRIARTFRDEAERRDEDVTPSRVADALFRSESTRLLYITAGDVILAGVPEEAVDAYAAMAGLSRDRVI